MNSRDMVRAAVLIFFLCAASGIFGQQQPQSQYQPTEVQGLRLQVDEDNVRFAMIQYQNAVQALVAEGKKVQTENGWPDTVVLDLGSYQFVNHPKPEAPKPNPVPQPDTKKPQ